jgi:hypothetical protein
MVTGKANAVGATITIAGTDTATAIFTITNETSEQVARGVTNAAGTSLMRYGRSDRVGPAEEG